MSETPIMKRLARHPETGPYAPELDFFPLSETTWRVCDCNCAEDDTRRILGYLQFIDGEYEMMWMRPRPGVSRRYPSLETATEAITRRLRSLP